MISSLRLCVAHEIAQPMRRALRLCGCLAALAGAREEDPLEPCEGAYGDLDWEAVRQQLERWADKYLDRQTLLNEVHVDSGILSSW